MKDWVKAKLDIIDELFPPHRIDRSKNRWTKLWTGEPDFDEYPFVLLASSFDYYAGSHTPEQRLRFSLDKLILHGQFQDDFVPTLFPGCKQLTRPH